MSPTAKAKNINSSKRQSRLQKLQQTDEMKPRLQFAKLTFFSSFCSNSICILKSSNELSESFDENIGPELLSVNVIESSDESDIYALTIIGFNLGLT
jgi:hypothetical protein